MIWPAKCKLDISVSCNVKEKYNLILESLIRIVDPNTDPQFLKSQIRNVILKCLDPNCGFYNNNPQHRFRGTYTKQQLRQICYLGLEAVEDLGEHVLQIRLRVHPTNELKVISRNGFFYIVKDFTMLFYDNFCIQCIL